MKTSLQGLAFLTRREGEVDRAYRDSVGVWTDGVGHTGRMSAPYVHPGDVITHQQSLRQLANDLAPLEASLASCLKVAVPQCEWDAMISLGFNIGQHGLVGSTVVHMTNAGNRPGAGQAFLMWEHPPELRARRELEKRLYLDGIYS